ncbi:MAG TPA: acyl-CoA dehydrogenase family protein [Xanthobacteraceae bacterium]|jgi:3-hydroxy-9,10-secoandrosta-1,3,5(10)-triene-9,17-dione monooxygenase
MADPAGTAEAAGTAEPAEPAPAEIVARARALAPALAARSLAARRARRLADETIAEMQDAGLFRVLQPRRWNGFEMDLGTFYEVELALAEGDMSTAWIYGVSGVHPWFMALLDDRAAQDVWGADRSTLICSSLMPAGSAVAAAGGFRLSGHWRYASGCEHCDWALLGGMVESEEGTPAHGRIFLLPRSDYRSLDAWQVSGLQATGSWDILVAEAFVPGYRSQAMLDNFLLKGAGQAVNTSALYRLPFGQIFVRGISTAALGALQGMLNALIDYGRTRVTRAGGRSAENPFVQLLCAETAAAIDEMKSILHRNFRALHAYARRGETPPLEERLRYKFESTAVTERCTLLAARIFKATGAAGLNESLPFGGILADLTAGRQHISNQYEHVGSSWGAVMLGLENRDLMV